MHCTFFGKREHCASYKPITAQEKRYITDSNAALDIARRDYTINRNVDKNDVMILLGL